MVTVQREDPLTQVRIHANLYGRSHAGRVVGAVLGALRPHLPGPVWNDLAARLPDGIEVTPSAAAAGDAREAFISDIAQRLNVRETDAAFYARVTFEQLNAYCHGVTPAAASSSAPAGLRGLLTARADDPASRHRLRLAAMGAAVNGLSLRRPAVERPAPVRLSRELTSKAARPAGR